MTDIEIEDNEPQIEGATLPEDQNGEENMAVVTCVLCASQKDISVTYRGSVTTTDDVLRGTLTCRDTDRFDKPCDGVTVFEMVNEGITFYPGRLFEVDIRRDVAPDASEMIHEAILCFYGSSNRGVVAFCRSAAEEALKAKDVPGINLDAKIKKAGKYLSAEELALANAARLTGRNALHRLAVVSHANALGALTNTIDFLNAVGEKTPFPAWLSERGSNEE